MAVWYSKGQCLGDIFVEVTEFLKVYTTYQHNKTNKRINKEEAMKKRENIFDCCKICKQLQYLYSDDDGVHGESEVLCVH